MQSREQIKDEMPQRWQRLADKHRRRTDALLHTIKTAQLSTELDRDALRDVLIAEHESALYHAARARGDQHQQAMEKSREGRREVDRLAGWR